MYYPLQHKTSPISWGKQLGPILILKNYMGIKYAGVNWILPATIAD